jgi:hypothetical protein
MTGISPKYTMKNRSLLVAHWQIPVPDNILATCPMFRACFQSAPPPTPPHERDYQETIVTRGGEEC